MGILQMNARELYDRADSIAENAFFKLLGRGLLVLLVPATLGMMGWIGNAIWELQQGQSRLSGEVAVLSRTLELQMSDRYRGADAVRDFRARDQKDLEQDRRIQDNADRIKTLENRPR